MGKPIWNHRLNHSGLKAAIIVILNHRFIPCLQSSHCSTLDQKLSTRSTNTVFKSSLSVDSTDIGSRLESNSGSPNRISGIDEHLLSKSSKRVFQMIVFSCSLFRDNYSIILFTIAFDYYYLEKKLRHFSNNTIVWFALNYRSRGQTMSRNEPPVQSFTDKQLPMLPVLRRGLDRIGSQPHYKPGVTPLEWHSKPIFGWLWLSTDRRLASVSVHHR